MNTKLKVRLLCKEAIVPTYATQGSSGLDLYAYFDTCYSSYYIFPHCIAKIGTGISVSIPYGYEGQIRPRSGLASKYGIGIVNSPGTIDSDYRGEVSVLLINNGSESFVLKRGDRIAQLVVAPIEVVDVVVVDELDNTKRGDGGFGSTGI